MLRLAATRGARLCGNAPLRAFATAAPPAGEEDLVTKVFKDQQAKFRAMVEGAKAIPVPVDGDAAAVAKFQAAYEALRKKVGVLSTDERLSRSLAALRESSADVRSFLTASAELRAAAGVSDAAGAEAALLEALDKAEAGGKPLLFSDAKGMAAFKASAAALQDKLGLKGANAATLEAAAAKEEAEATVAAVKAARDDAVATAKQRDGLSYL